MPYLVNPEGVVVCVGEQAARELKALPPTRWKKGNQLIGSIGFRDATTEEIAALREVEAKATEELSRAEAEKALHAKSFTTQLIDGMRALASEGKSSAKRNQ